ncbi:MAG: mechanosensitive ion channel [Gammaproteobacteria bacterium]|nr:MAG: mechanosensitive ion channel [Gammaproteobacteria bacterium]
MNLSAELPEIADWLPESLQPAWDLIVTLPIVGGLVVAVVFYLAAFAFRGLVLNTISRLAARTDTHLDNTIIDHLRRPVFNTILYFGLILAVNVAALPFGRVVLINVFASVIVVSWMSAALRISNALLDAFSLDPRITVVEPRTIPMFDLVMKLTFILVASYCLLMVWGINPLGWLASAGIVGIAVGFAAKDTLANLFSGFFIVADAPYKLGDYINLDSGERGQVTAIGMRSTRLLTRADVEITIPNAVIANAKITNESGGANEKMRLRILVGVAYGTDADEVCALLRQIGEANPEVCSDPAPRVRMRGFGASSVDFNLLAWIEQPEDRGRISHALYMEIYRVFAEQNIEIPYAKQDVFIKELPDRLDPNLDES